MAMITIHGRIADARVRGSRVPHVGCCDLLVMVRPQLRYPYKHHRIFLTGVFLAWTVTCLPSSHVRLSGWWRSLSWVAVDSMISMAMMHTSVTHLVSAAGIGEDGSSRKACGGWGSACFPLAQVHDELLFEVQEEAVPMVAAMVKDSMEGTGNMFGLSVPLPVNIRIGPSYGELAPYRVVINNNSR